MCEEKMQEYYRDSKEEAYAEAKMYEDEEFCAEKVGLQDIIDDLSDLVKKYESYGHIFDCRDWMK